MAKRKRYHQSVKDRMAESRGMERHYAEAYAGMDPRRRLEMEDSGMIHEDRSAPANLPQGVKYHPWPQTGYSKYRLDDTIRGVDKQMDDDMKMQKKEQYPEKY